MKYMKKEIKIYCCWLLVRIKIEKRQQTGNKQQATFFKISIKPLFF
jgi:hypothetical protein